jgi:hypothetical protein
VRAPPTKKDELSCFPTSFLPLFVKGRISSIHMSAEISHEMLADNVFKTNRKKKKKETFFPLNLSHFSVCSLQRVRGQDISSSVERLIG